MDTFFHSIFLKIDTLEIPFAMLKNAKIQDLHGGFTPWSPTRALPLDPNEGLGDPLHPQP